MCPINRCAFWILASGSILGTDDLSQRRWFFGPIPINPFVSTFKFISKSSSCPMTMCVHSVKSNCLQDIAQQAPLSISFSRESSWPRDWTHISWVSCIGRQVLYQLSHQGSLPIPSYPAPYCHIISPMPEILIQYKKFLQSYFSSGLSQDIIWGWNGLGLFEWLGLTV